MLLLGMLWRNLCPSDIMKQKAPSSEYEVTITETVIQMGVKDGDLWNEPVTREFVSHQPFTQRQIAASAAAAAPDSVQSRYKVLCRLS